jgi:putative oxidoreductase
MITDPTLTDVATLSAGLLVGRAVLGLAMAAHGAQKLFGWFGGHGLAGTAGFFEMLGFRPARLFAFGAAAGELVSGLLVASGLLGPVGPALILALMIVAALAVHWKHGFFVMTNGVEVPVLYATGALTLAFTGYGAFSLDAVLGLDALASGPIAMLAMVFATAAALGTLALRRPAESPAA